MTTNYSTPNHKQCFDLPLAHTKHVSPIKSEEEEESQLTYKYKYDRSEHSDHVPNSNDWQGGLEGQT